MWYPESKHRDAMRHGLGRSVFGRWMAFLLLCGVLVPSLSHAACTPLTPPDASAASPMPAGGRITIDGSSCAPFGTSGITSAAGHGTATVTNNAAATIDYVNSGDGATTDTFQFDDGSGTNSITVTVYIAAATSSLALSPSSMPSGTVAVSYATQTLSASGGTGPYTFALSSGGLPPGLTLSGNTLSGTPTTQGSYSFSITATDSASATGTASYSITIGPASVNITNTPTDAVINQPYTFNLTASGGTPPYTYTMDGGTTLPAGLSLSSTGTISGTPTALGPKSFTVRVTDSSLPSHFFSGNNLSITVQNLPPPVANPVSATVAYGSANNPITLNLTGGAPASVAVGTQASHGTATASGTSITYTPTAGYAGPDSFTYTATNGSGTSMPATATLTVSPPTITYTPSSPAAGTVGVAYSQSLAGANGGASPYTYAIVSGSLPAGVTLAANGTLSGTPTANGTFNFTVRATDNSTGTGPFSSTSSTLTLSIGAPTITYSPASPLPGTVGVAYSRSLAVASGGTAPYTYALASGSLPAGITLASNGTLSGTPTAGGSYNFTVTATDSSGGTGPFSATSGTLTLSTNAPTLTILPASLANSTVGLAYSQSMTASGGTAGYTYAVTAGALPAGLSVSNAGVISGTPTASGTYNFIITTTDSSTGTGPYTGSRAYTITVGAPTMILAPSSGTTFNGTAGSPVSATFNAGNGTSPYTYTISAGALPAGVTLSPTGTLSGTPTAAGNFSFTVHATDSSTGTGAPFIVAGNYTLAVVAPTISLSPGTLPPPTVGNAYSQTLAASESQPTTFTYNVTSGLLPTGLSLDSNSGVLSGTPTAAGSFNFTVTATDAGGFTGSQAYSVTVGAGTVVLDPGAPASATAEAPYTHTFSASGGTAPYAYSLAAGAMPAGLSLSSTGVLSGTPTVAGTFNFTVRATDSSTGSSAPFTGSRAYTLTVAAPTITLAPATLPAGTGGVAYSQTLTASGGNGGYTYSLAAGALPPGIALSSSGSLSGTPTTTGSYSFTVTATDGFGFSGSQAYTFAVAAPGITLSPTTLPAGTGGVAYSQPLSASGGNGGYTYSLAAGALPPGIAMSSSGSLSGTPTTTGSYSFTVTATDGFGFTGSQAYTLQVGAPAIALTPAALPAGVGGVAYSQSLSASGGNGGYTYSLAAGALPPGIALSSSGSLSGTPTTTGSYTFTVTATDGFGFTGSQAYTLDVGAPTVVFTPTTLPGAQATAAYSQTVIASGGSGSFTYGLTAGALPPGIALGSNGSLTGTPTAAGNFNFTITATDSFGFSGSQAYTLAVDVPTITLTPTTLPAGAGGTAYSQALDASGGSGGYSYSLSAGTLPAGIALSSAGVISGTPTASGSFSFTVTATDSLGFTGSQAYTLQVGAPTIAITPAALPVAIGGVAYGQALSASGGHGGYTYSLAAGTLPPGVALSSSGSLSGTPTTAGSFNFTVRATDGFGFTGSQAYTFQVNAPTIAFTPTALPGGQVAVAYSQAVSATGGSGSFTYSLTSGALPSGVALSSGGAISGTPTAAGSFSFTVTATDNFGFSGSQAYTVSIGQPAPVAKNDSATTQANAPATVAVTANDTGPITHVTVAQAPAHGTATVSGLDVVYSPASNFFGNDTFTYTATGPGGTSAPATVSVTVTPLAVPVAAVQSATVLAGQSVTIHAAAQAANGPFTAAAVVSAPSSGTATVQGTDIVYTADADASGTFGLDYTLSNVFGTSQPAHVTLTVNPRPVAPALKTTVLAGTVVQVDLTTQAHGGPFTGAEVVSVSPASAGSATISARGDGGYTMAFTAAPAFGGVARVTYTLSNAFATSTPGTVDITVELRSDPSRDAEVLGVLEAQAESARRMALGQIGNFQRRLESLHNGGSHAGFSNGITLNSASSLRRADASPGMQQTMGGGDPFLVPAGAPADDQTPPAAAPGGLGFWAGGALNFGKLQAGSSDNGIDFTTSGLSLGADKQVTSSLALGLGVGYGHDASDIGRHGSHSSVDSYNVAAYGSYQPGEAVYVDALAGYQWLQFDARRFVTDNGNTVRGSRDGKQWFASVSVGYQHQADDMLLTPYGRLDIARATLGGYTETGDDVFALSYQGQAVKTSTATLGVLARWTVQRDYGVWAPQLRAEFGHDVQGSSQAVMRYADLLSGPLYQATLSRQSRNHTLLGAGITLQTLKGWSLRAEYQNQLDNTSRDNQSLMFGVQKALQP